MRPTIEVADIFRRHGDAFRAAQGARVSRAQLRVMRAIEATTASGTLTPDLGSTCSTRQVTDAIVRFLGEP